MIKAFVLDDELPALRGMEYLLSRENDFEYRLFQNYLDAIDAVKTDCPDVVFLDIDMPSANGIELALKLQDIKHDIIIVFVTAHAEYAVDAFKAYPVDYILKPVDEDRFEKTLSHIRKVLGEKKSVSAPDREAGHFRIHTLGGFLFVPTDYSSAGVVNGRRFQELFAFLLYRNGMTVTRSELIDILFDGVMNKKNINYLHVMIYNLRKLLTSLDISYTLSFSNESYILNISKGYCDIIDIACFVDENRMIDGTNAEHAAALVKEYGGTFFENADYVWIDEARKWADKMFERLVIRLSKYYINTGRYYGPEKYLSALLEKKPYSQAIWNIFLDMFVRSGNKISYIKQYERYRRILKTEFDSEPETVWTKHYRNYLLELKER